VTEEKGTAMRKALLGLAILGLVVGQGPGAVAAPADPDPGDLDHVGWTTEFPTGQFGAFAESMAPDGHGGMIVSVTTWGPEDMTGPHMGQLWRVRSDGTKSEFGPPIDLSPFGMLTGAAVDDHGQVFVGVFNFAAENDVPVAEDPESGVLKVTADRVERWMTLPEISMPNELVAHAGSLYVTDSQNGFVWKGSTSRQTVPAAPWFASALLAPVSGMGANGITVGMGALYVSSYDRGLILRIPVGSGQASGAARVLVEDRQLIGADGVALDHRGRLWVAVSGQHDYSTWPPGITVPPEIAVVTPNGRIATAGTPEGSLDYPTAVVLGRNGTVYVANGSYFLGAPNVVALMP
jgi:sugar lactone lactonase YvrE